MQKNRWILGVLLTALVTGGILPVEAGLTSAAVQEDPLHHDQRARLEKARRDAAFKDLKDEAEELRVGSEELKEMIDKSNPFTYSTEILKKAEDLEKIIKSIKKRAKRGFE